MIVENSLVCLRRPEVKATVRQGDTVWIGASDGLYRLHQGALVPITAWSGRKIAAMATAGDGLFVAAGSADGLVLHGSRLTVIRNVSRVLTTLRLDPDARTADLLDVTPTDPSRVFTTGKEARGRLLLVDSKFDEQVAAPPYEVVAVPLPR